MKNKLAYDALMKFYPLTLDDLPGELWQPVPDFDAYHVSNFGRVKSFKSKTRIRKPKFSVGYLCINLSKNGKVKTFRLHRLVALTFIPNPEGKPQINPRDGCKLNNHVSNLEWCTSSENIQHAYDTGLKESPSGEDRSDTKLTNEQAAFIRANPDNLNLAQLAEMFGVCIQTISAVQLGERYKKADGFIRQLKFKHIPEEVKAQIRADYQPSVRGFGCKSLAKKYGVDPTTIRRIVNLLQAGD